LKSISSFQEIKTTPVLISFSARVEINRFHQILLKSSFEMCSSGLFAVFRFFYHQDQEILDLDPIRDPA